MDPELPFVANESSVQWVSTMKESVTYQALLKEGMAEGKAEEARRILLLLGRDQLGEPPASVQATLDAVADVSRLEELAMRLKHATSWPELLGKPGTCRRTPRKKPSS